MQRDGGLPIIPWKYGTCTSVKLVVSPIRPTIPSFAEYITSKIARANTDSWLLVPLLLSALGRSVEDSWRFQRPPRWGQFVERLRRALYENGRLNRVPLLSVGGGRRNYIDAETQEELVAFDVHVNNTLVTWIARVRGIPSERYDDLPPLPTWYVVYTTLFTG